MTVVITKRESNQMSGDGQYRGGRGGGLTKFSQETWMVVSTSLFIVIIYTFHFLKFLHSDQAGIGLDVLISYEHPIKLTSCSLAHTKKLPRVTSDPPFHACFQDLQN